MQINSRDPAGSAGSLITSARGRSSAPNLLMAPRIAFLAMSTIRGGLSVIGKFSVTGCGLRAPSLLLTPFVLVSHSTISNLELTNFELRALASRANLWSGGEPFVQCDEQPVTTKISFIRRGRGPIVLH